MSTITWPAHAGIRSEVGRLRTVMLHRPGHELRRLTPRNNDELLFDGMPWVSRAQEEHDAFAQTLRDHGVQVLLLGELLAETLAIPEARARAVDLTLDDLHMGASLRNYLASAINDATPERLADVMMAGLRNDELTTAPRTLVTSMLAADDFLIRPLPNLLFTRDSSVWIGDHPAITSLFFDARARENHITSLIYRYHPAFEAHEPFYGWNKEHVEGGDVLALAPGVLAIGVGERTTPAGVERLARTVFRRGEIHTILAVPLDKERAQMHLDTVCTMVDVDTVIMYPNIANTISAYVVTPTDGDAASGELHIGPREGFFPAAARAMGIDQLKHIHTGMDSVTAEREQWDDGNNTLAIGPKLCIAYERNDNTNERLEHNGIEVLRIAGSELGSGRGGPRCMSCPIDREDLPK